MDPATAAWARPLVDAWQENLRRQLDQFGTTTRSARRRSNADDNGGGADLFLLNGLSVPCGAEVVRRLVVVVVVVVNALKKLFLMGVISLFALRSPPLSRSNTGERALRRHGGF